MSFGYDVIPFPSNLVLYSCSHSAVLGQLYVVNEIEISTEDVKEAGRG